MNVAKDVARSFVDVAREAPLRRSVAETLDLSALPPYQVQLLPGETLIALTVVAASPALARDVANALAEALVALSPSGILLSNEERLLFMDEQMSILEREIALNEAALAREVAGLNLDDRTVPPRIARRIAALEDTLADQRNSYAALVTGATGGSANTLQLLEPASLPAAPRARNWRIVPVGALLGLLLATGAAYLLPLPASRGAEPLPPDIRPSSEP
jgi:uncharacterized protein involved in exopolysaccharide biosynthesis